MCLAIQQIPISFNKKSSESYEIKEGDKFFKENKEGFYSFTSDSIKETKTELNSLSFTDCQGASKKINNSLSELEDILNCAKKVANNKTCVEKDSESYKKFLKDSNLEHVSPDAASKEINLIKKKGR